MSEKNYKLTITHYKLLDTVAFLNEQHKYPLQEGVFKIVSGQEDDESRSYQDVPTYGTMISYSSKKISRLCIMLIRYKYLGYIFDRKTNQLYLQITEKGKTVLFDFHKHHKNGYCKTKKQVKATIVEIK